MAMILHMFCTRALIFITRSRLVIFNISHCICFSYIQGMHGFVLNEHKQRQEAEKYTKKVKPFMHISCGNLQV